MCGNIGLHVHVYCNEGFRKCAAVYMEVIERFLLIGYATTLFIPPHEM
jgi:hypothetical protein